MIVACPSCRTRYDVTGRPPGTRARCRCGTVFELPDAPQPVRALECPRCGGHVSATDHRCEFCNVPLMVKACPRCFARMFHEAKHCGNCGNYVVVPAAADPEGTARVRHCPRCVTPTLYARLIGNVMLDECPECQGTFVDVAALERILHARRQSFVLDVMNELSPPGTTGSFQVPIVPAPQVQTVTYVKCPDCDNVMNRRNFGGDSGIIIDVCRVHGTWFDKDELTQVVEFAMSGRVPYNKRQDNETMRERALAARALAADTSSEPESRTAKSLAKVAEVFRALGAFLQS